MKSVFTFVATVVSGFVALTGVVSAAPIITVPEPGSLALVGLAIVGLVLVARKGKK